VGVSGGIVVLVVIGVVVLVPLVYVGMIFNRLVALRAYIRNSWSQIQVEMKRRYDLIPNLVEVVKGYAAHERETLEAVTALRNRAAANEGAVASQSSDERALEGGLRRLFAVAEAYPELKADRSFRELQTELVNTEDRLAAARRFYNGNVRDMNQLVGQFPSGMVARMFGFKVWEYFQLEDEGERAAPEVRMG
jgi:LemA protein